MKRISKKQQGELAKRRKLKIQLIQESGGLCMKCGNKPDFRGLELVHLKSLGQGGKTTRENCAVWCAECHAKEGHNIRVVKSEVQWSKGEVSNG